MIGLFYFYCKHESAVVMGYFRKGERYRGRKTKIDRFTMIQESFYWIPFYNFSENLYYARLQLCYYESNNESFSFGVI